MSFYRAISVFFVVISYIGTAFGSSLNKCVNPDGRVEFTDQPCPLEARSSSIENTTSSKKRASSEERRPDIAPPLPSLESKKSAPARSQQPSQQSLAQDNIGGRQQYPTLYVPSPSNPPIAAFISWHDSLLRKDFAAYKNIAFWLPEVKENSQRQMFDQLRINTPAQVKITEQKTNPNGSVSFTAVGCNEGRRLINVITAARANGAWRVASTGWGAPWNETAKLCPV